MILAIIDPWILTFSAATVIVTIWMGFWSARRSKTASDFFVAGRSVSVGWNASAISGEYLSAASFMGVAGMVMSSGYDALWYPVCYACGYLFLLLFIAGPLRRFGAYTIPDFAEGRYDSPVFRKIAVVFVLFIGFFYTMPQMKGAGTTLAYIFPGLPYWAGVVLVGAVITLNVALGGMKGITLVQAFQYWAKMFAISVPIFVLMAVYGHYGKQLGANGDVFTEIYHPVSKLELKARDAVGDKIADVLHLDRPEAHGFQTSRLTLYGLLISYGKFQGKSVEVSAGARNLSEVVPFTTNSVDASNFNHYGKPLIEKYGFNIAAENSRTVRFVSVKQPVALARSEFSKVGAELKHDDGVDIVWLSTNANLRIYRYAGTESDASGRAFYTYSLGHKSLGSEAIPGRESLPEKAPADSTWLSPFGPLTTKAAKAAAATPISTNQTEIWRLKPGVKPGFVTVFQGPTEVDRLKDKVKAVWHEKVTKRRGTGAGAAFVNETNSVHRLLDSYAQDHWCTVLRPADLPDTIIRVPTNAYPQGQFGDMIERVLATNGVIFLHEENELVKAVPAAMVEAVPSATVITAEQIRPYALLYTYSLIIALVCGTAGLPHILVRFYTNPDGVAAKRTTMWVMILIGIFYVFPPVFGVMGRNLMPELYAGVGAKGTDKIVLELPRLLNEKYAPLGSILSGITCAGAFAAFMSTFSGLLVSMTGALAHDVYGRMLKPKSTSDQRMKAFRLCAVIVGAVAIVLGMQVEPFQINFMVGQAFAIAAASYFPLLFMSAWWRGMTMKGAAAGMLTGGLLALGGITLTSFSDLKWLPLDAFWAAHPLLRILCEQPAIWAVPLAITLMVVISKLTTTEVPFDVRMKMLVLHAPEKLGLKQEYIQEHQHGH